MRKRAKTYREVELERDEERELPGEYAAAAAVTLSFREDLRRGHPDVRIRPQPPSGRPAGHAFPLAPGEVEESRVVQLHRVDRPCNRVTKMYLPRKRPVPPRERPVHLIRKPFATYFRHLLHRISISLRIPRPCYAEINSFPAERRISSPRCSFLRYERIFF